MKIKILGSAAAEALPALWCECETCRLARMNKGRDIRRRTSYLLDDDTLIDYGPDIYFQSIAFDIDLQNIKRIFITHSHEDHLDAIELLWRQGGYSRVTKWIDIYSNQTVIERLHKDLGVYNSVMQTSLDPLKIRNHQLSVGKEEIIDDIKLLPLEASHASPEEDAMNFILERNEKKVLIGNDTGWWKDSTWEMVKDAKMDAAIIESCSPVKPMNYSGHLDGTQTVAFRDKLLELRALKPDAKVYTNHFSHNGGLVLQEEMEKFFHPQGITVCYDGLDIEI